MKVSVFHGNHFLRIVDRTASFVLNRGRNTKGTICADSYFPRPAHREQGVRRVAQALHGSIPLVSQGYGMILNRTFLTSIFVALALVVSGVLIAAETDTPEKSPKPEGFRFKGGNPEVGQTAFVVLSCIECHSVKGVNFEKPPHERLIDLPLAVEKRFVKQYEDIILAITNPRHVINEQYRAILKDAEIRGEIEPLMPDLTDRMSAAQLMDLTAFLHGAYSRALPEYGVSKDD